MRAIILAAGFGRRLGEHGKAPKCLLEFGGRTLLDRHIRNLNRLGIDNITLCIGYESELVESALGPYTGISTIRNPDFRTGSIVSLWTTRAVLGAGDDVLLMDADVLYAPKILAPLLNTPIKNRFLYDRDFIPGDEPVKICLDCGRIVEFRKQLAPDLHYNDCGESIGFFSFERQMAARLAAVTEAYVEAGRRDEPYEEAIRDLALAHPEQFRVEDVTGIPWVEIDFPEDITRANEQILPQIDDN